MALPQATLLRRGLVRTTAAHRPAPSLFVYPGIASRPWWRLQDLPQRTADSIQRIVDARAVLLAEYDAAAAAQPRGDYDTREGEHTLHEGAWTWHSAVKKGALSADFAVACPQTTALLSDVPDLLMGGIPFAYTFFSRMAPGTVIAPHFGPANIRVRVHVPLRLPPPGSGDAALVVAGEARPWQLAQPLLFDDSYEHSSHNKTAAERLVLLLDLWHPELSLDERLALQGMFGEAREKGWLK